ncbi:aminotransferase class IV [Henriciella aquimarina]|uniref:aminotransferase class IV n=1 Tax=Henriciella aquimarina TaxID=545261 RepID=UPI0009FD2D56|nr:aminotransferase class IV [Henriciella aquimarina]
MPIIRLNQAASSIEAVQPFDLTDRGLLLGDGIFDTSLVINGEIVLRARHIQRLLKACDAFALPLKREALEALADSALPAGATGALRLTVTRGPGVRGLGGDVASTPTLLVSFTPQAQGYPYPPVRLAISAIQRNPTAPSSRYKTLAYTDAIAGHRAAQAAGFDDALYCTPAGHLACTSIANLFVCYGDKLVTPPLTDGIVEGVMRNWILENAGAAGFQASEDSLSIEALEKADHVFMANSLRLMVPVSRVGKTSFDARLPSGFDDLIREQLLSERDG